MTDREKLFELLRDGKKRVYGWFPNNVTMMQIADYLLANGVTFATDTNVGHQWCEKVLGGPDPDQHRDCSYFGQKTNADLMIEMLKMNDARSLLEWWEEILEDGVPGYDYFESWLQKPPKEGE